MEGDDDDADDNEEGRDRSPTIESLLIIARLNTCVLELQVREAVTGKRGPPALDGRLPDTVPERPTPGLILTLTLTF